MPTPEFKTLVTVVSTISFANDLYSICTNFHLLAPISTDYHLLTPISTDYHLRAPISTCEHVKQKFPSNSHEISMETMSPKCLQIRGIMISILLYIGLKHLFLQI